MYGTRKFRIPSTFASSASHSNQQGRNDMMMMEVSATTSTSRDQLFQCPPSKLIAEFVQHEAMTNNEQIIFNLVKGIAPLSEKDKIEYVINRQHEKSNIFKSASSNMEEAFKQANMENSQLSQVKNLDFLEKDSFVDLGDGCGLRVQSLEDLKFLLYNNHLKPARNDWNTCKLRSKESVL
jgi:hypothetical protein